MELLHIHITRVVHDLLLSFLLHWDLFTNMIAHWLKDHPSAHVTLQAALGV